MNHTEIRSCLILAAIFALRMLGLFIILPVFSMYAKDLAALPGQPSNNEFMLGIALGMYGLVQAFLHIPLGILSDYIGRKPVILAGLALFVIGAIIAAIFPNLLGIAVGRSIQGAGAISAAITALVIESTREKHHSKGMAIIGASIAIAFAISLVIATPIYQYIGMQGIFWLMASLGAGAILLIVFALPKQKIKITEAIYTNNTSRSQTKVFQNLYTLLGYTALWRLNFGVLVLHTVQIAMFMIVPRLLVESGLPLFAHWKIYLPVLLGSFILMLPLMLLFERAGKIRLLIICAIALLFVTQILFTKVEIIHDQGIGFICILLLLFFVGFNLLESIQPTLVASLASKAKGAALGIYNTSQALGLFLGGSLGGLIFSKFGTNMVFLSCAFLLLLWLIIAFKMQQIPRRQTKIH